VLTKIELGEADAGLVYVTDVVAAGDAVEGIEVPEAAEVVNGYPIVVLKDAPNAAAAHAWVEYVLSAEGRQALAAAGFVAP
jgi:molybdate transport system substrate-binding protein